jgi:hypothetical protein
MILDIRFDLFFYTRNIRLMNLLKLFINKKIFIILDIKLHLILKDKNLIIRLYFKIFNITF